MSINYLNPIWAVLVYAISIFSAFLALQYGAHLERQGRYASIDGLRGLLALGVFVCHSAVWFSYQSTGIWRNNPSPIYMHLGEASVVIFFMVTSFLFWGKVLDSSNKNINWIALYKGRCLRIVPLYLTALIIMAGIVVIASEFTLKVTIAKLSWQIFSWSTFTLTGLPSINGFRETTPIMGVAWTLRYEWLFYFSLPLLAGITRQSFSVKWITISIMLVLALIFLMFRLEKEILPSFAFGMIAAYAVRRLDFTKVLARPVYGILVVFGLYLLCKLYPTTAYNLGAEFILFICFLIIASGNTLGGILAARPVRLLGQISYSIYLMHSFLLYIAFGMIVRNNEFSPISPSLHWGFIQILSVFLVVISYATWKIIESKFLKTGN